MSNDNKTEANNLKIENWVDREKGPQPMPTSQFYMWRCIAAIAHAHADGKVTPKERDYLEKAFATLAQRYTLSAEQKAILAVDLDKAQKIEDLLSYINDPEYRGMLISYGEIMARLNGVIDPEEEHIIEHLRTGQAHVDVQALQKDVHEYVGKLHAQDEAEKEAIRQELFAQGKYGPATLALKALDPFLRKHFGIDLIFD